MFPLGEKTKSDTREVARHCQLKTADKEESMEICFVPDNNYGFVDVTWGGPDTMIGLGIVDVKGVTRFRYDISLSELRP
jgi:tRNA U34 2-thiouridine synthase MnmA/TrmU